MKGISLAIETIIFIILAVLVLTVLLFFFTSQAGPAQTRFQLETQRNQLCGSYVQNDRLCSGDGTNPTGGSKVINDLIDVCTKLDVACKPTDRLACIQNCCIICSKKPQPK